NYQWVDLHGEGIPGVLTEQASAWYYKRNISPVSEGRVALEPLTLVARKPNVSVAAGQAQIMDLAGDGGPTSSCWMDPCRASTSTTARKAGTRSDRSTRVSAATAVIST